MKTIAISQLKANLIKILKDTRYSCQIYFKSKAQIVAKLFLRMMIKNAQKRLNEISKNAK